MIENYPWLKLLSVRTVRAGDKVMTSGGKVITAVAGSDKIMPIVEADNCYNLLDLADLKIPEGYEIDGESLAKAFRDASKWHGEYIGENTSRSVLYGPCRGDDMRRLCLRKIAPKTKRVLIAEAEIGADGKCWGGDLHPRFDPEAAVLRHPTIYRIEQRPI